MIRNVASDGALNQLSVTSHYDRRQPREEVNTVERILALAPIVPPS
jgi:hypothetical protein